MGCNLTLEVCAADENDDQTKGQIYGWMTYKPYEPECSQRMSHSEATALLHNPYPTAGDVLHFARSVPGVFSVNTWSPGPLCFPLRPSLHARMVCVRVPRRPGKMSEYSDSLGAFKAWRQRHAAHEAQVEWAVSIAIHGRNRRLWMCRVRSGENVWGAMRFEGQVSDSDESWRSTDTAWNFIMGADRWV